MTRKHAGDDVRRLHPNHEKIVRKTTSTRHHSAQIPPSRVRCFATKSATQGHSGTTLCGAQSKRQRATSGTPSGFISGRHPQLCEACLKWFPETVVTNQVEPPRLRYPVLRQPINSTSTGATPESCRRSGNDSRNCTNIMTRRWRKYAPRLSGHRRASGQRSRGPDAPEHPGLVWRRDRVGVPSLSWTTSIASRAW